MKVFSFVTIIFLGAFLCLMTGWLVPRLNLRFV